MARELVVRLIGDDLSLRRAFLRSSTGAKGFERDIGRAGRGALAGSGAFKSLGRSIAFASGGFLAFASAGQFLRKSVDAAKEAQVVQKQLAAQFRASGKDLGDYQAQIDHTSNRLALLAGFQNDEVKSAFLTIFRTTGNVSKALRDTATAADLARAKNISLAQASLIIAKTEAGNTTLLRRQGFEIKKNASSTKALAQLRQTVAGQARAGTTEQERFGAVLHDTEEIIGTGILPVLNKYLASAALWLTQVNESGKLQKEVNKDFAAARHVIDDVAGAVKKVDGVTGSFKNTLELLLALKVASKLAGTASSIGLIGSEAVKADGKVSVLKGSLGRLGAIGAILIPIEIVIHRKQIDDTMHDLRNRVVKAQQNFKPIQILAKGESEVANAPGIKQALGLFGVKNVTPESLLKPVDTIATSGEKSADHLQLSAAKVAKETTDFGVRVARAIKTANATIKAAAGLNITSAQRNTFFDNAISRILLRGGLGDIQQQIGALQRANALIAARIRSTKDVTRKLNLEDEILQNAFQIKGLQDQATQNAVQARQDALQKRQDAVAEFIAGLQLGVTKAQATAGLGNDITALKALQAGIRSEIKEFGNTADLAGQLFDVQQQLKQTKTAQISARQFRQLGLSATGDVVTPSVANLKKQVASLGDRISGTSLATPKLKSELARFRKVLSEGLVPTDVRQKIRDMLADIRDELKNGSANLTKFRHVNSNQILSGLGLSPDEIRKLRPRIAQLGHGGTVPSSSVAFSAAGANSGTFVLHGDIIMDGQKVGRIANSGRIKQGKKRTIPRAG